MTSNKPVVPRRPDFHASRIFGISDMVGMGAIAEMYDPDRMDSEFPLVREGRDRNDEVLSASTAIAASKTT